MPDRSSPAIPWLVHDPRRVLVAADRAPVQAATLNVRLDRLHQRVELRLIVEGVDHDVAVFVPLRIKTVVPHDEAPDAVIPDVHPAHAHRLGRPLLLKLTVDRPRTVPSVS
jgi:hypothetical protein